MDLKEFSYESNGQIAFRSGLERFQCVKQSQKAPVVLYHRDLFASFIGPGCLCLSSCFSGFLSFLHIAYIPDDQNLISRGVWLGMKELQFLSQESWCDKRVLVETLTDDPSWQSSRISCLPHCCHGSDHSGLGRGYHWFRCLAHYLPVVEGLGAPEMKGGFIMSVVPIQDCDIYYDVADYTHPWLDQKDTVVMHHGFCRTSNVWYAWVPFLARYFQVLRIDARGCGRSCKPEERFEPSLDGFTQDLGQVLGALGIKQVHFIGESFGGIIGLNLARSFPGRVKSLILCNTPCRLPETLPGKYAVGFKDTATAIQSLGVQEWCLRTIGYRLDEQLATVEMQHWYAREMDRTPSWFASPRSGVPPCCLLAAKA